MLYNEGVQVENLKKHMRIKIKDLANKNEVHFLKDYLRIRVPTLVKHFNNNLNNDHGVDYDSFVKVLKTFNLNQKYTDEVLLKALYEQPKFKSEKGNFDYKLFVDDILDHQDDNNFFDFKEVKIVSKIFKFRNI